jgi:hypothetical protein
MWFETNLKKSNSYYRVLAPFDVYTVAGHIASNTWIGRTRVLDPVYDVWTLEPGDNRSTLSLRIGRQASRSGANDRRARRC